LLHTDKALRRPCSQHISSLSLSYLRRCLACVLQSMTMPTVVATVGAQISSTTVEGLTNLSVVSAPFGDISAIQRANECALYSLGVANSPSPTDIGRLYAVPFDECYVRGDFKFLRDKAGQGGVQEKALAAMTNGTDISQSIVFFTTNDCDPDNRIKDAETWKGCSANAQNNPKDGWKSWQVWDMCLDKPGCDLIG
jgi:hypothetical protein